MLNSQSVLRNDVEMTYLYIVWHGTFDVCFESSFVFFFLILAPWVGGQIFFGRNHPQVYPHMHAKFGHDRSGSLAAYT